MLRRVGRLSVVVGLCAASGCYWSPTNGSNQQSTTTVSLSGFSLFADDVLTLKATNLTVGGESSTSVTASGTPITIIRRRLPALRVVDEPKFGA